MSNLLALKFLTIENGDVKLHLLFSRAQCYGSVTVDNGLW